MEPSDKATQAYRPIDSVLFLDYLQPIHHVEPTPTHAAWVEIVGLIQKMAKAPGKIIMVRAQVRK
jgi:hypothetical protein